MSFHSILTWTWHGLTGAFLQLALASSLLFISFSLYVPSKFLKLFVLCFPRPCSWFFRYSNRNLCIDNLLVKLPKQMIASIFNSVLRKFPFELIFSEDQRCASDEILIRDRNYETGVLLQLEANNFSGPSFRNMIGKEGRHEAKRRRITRQRTRITSSNAVANIAAKESGSSSVLKDYNNTIKEDLNGKIYLNGKIREVEIDKANLVETLERALEEEEAAIAALYSELEKERAASASAAEEAMAMICRLQHDKAMIEMEAKQYRRLVDEMLAYNEEETSIVEEILTRREMDTRFLEKEIEAYMEMF